MWQEETSRGGQTSSFVSWTTPIDVELVSSLPFGLIPSPSTSRCSFLIVSEILCVSEVTVELEGLRTVVDAFLDYMGVASCTR
jgi:hypothetical protein